MHSLKEVKDTAKTFLISDCYAVWFPYGPDYLEDTCHGRWDSGVYTYARHSPTKFGGRGVNIIFVDGHAEFARSKGIGDTTGPGRALSLFHDEETALGVASESRLATHRPAQTTEKCGCN
ncbi:MAG: hypothetical protein HY360_26625 [Verrucomicrobia bacterium]|nr:hypothetical protein [Verrucomicrobiota bacterium]